MFSFTKTAGVWFVALCLIPTWLYAQDLVERKTTINWAVIRGAFQNKKNFSPNNATQIKYPDNPTGIQKGPYLPKDKSPLVINRGSQNLQLVPIAPGDTKEGMVQNIPPGNELVLPEDNSKETIPWKGTQQWGTVEKGVEFRDIQRDRVGNIYLVLSVAGNFEGFQNNQEWPPNVRTHAYVMKLNKHGDRLWIQQIASNSYDTPKKLQIDPAGNIYLLMTYGGSEDRLVVLNSHGEVLNNFNIAASGGKSSDYQNFILGSDGYFYMLGSTAILEKFSIKNNALVKDSQLDLPRPGKGIVEDGKGTFFVFGDVTGSADSTAVSYGGSDVYVTAINNMGMRWTRQLGSNENEYSQSMFLDETNDRLLITGRIQIKNSAGPNPPDAFLGSISLSDQFITFRPFHQWGTEGYEEGHDLKVDGSGNVFLSGKTEVARNDKWVEGVLFLAKFDPKLQLVWFKRFEDKPWRITNETKFVLDNKGDILLAGYGTGGFKEGFQNLNIVENTGGNDAFLMKFSRQDGSIQ